MLVLFSFTLFLSAFLLFWVQLMVGKMILPFLGGSPAVWNTCLFFFQATLLLGYGYSHLTSTWFSARRQAILHSILLLLPIAFLPITISGNPPQESNPILWILILLSLSVGLPFFLVSTSAPLIQKWFANTGHPASEDPYFLYVASNLGSLLGVLSYPILIEPNFSLTDQSWLWAIGYGLLILLTVGCVISFWRNGKEALNNEATVSPIQSLESSPSIQQQAQWIILSFLPSSLLLGVTTYITTDLAAIPLLWAIPLAIYLLTFIFTFARKPLLPHNRLVAILPLLLAPLIILSLLMVIQPVWLLLPLHLLGFFVTACVFHGELAKTRPPANHLTLFYFCLSLGGVLGGLFNAIAAPLVFPSVLEYPLILGLSLLLLRTYTESTKEEKETDKNKTLGLSKTLPISMGLLLGSLIVGFQIKTFSNNIIGLLFALVLLIGIRYAFAIHPIRFVAGLALIVLLSQFSIPSMGGILDTERSFFGVNRVLNDQERGYHILLHGTTVHGKQSLDPQRRREPLTYFYPTGPIGQFFASLKSNEGGVTTTKPPSKIAVMGLGIGTLAAYAERGQQWTFYEIDPLVEKLALDSRYFTFLQDATAPFSIVLGDGRLRLADASDHSYDVIVMDAFSSDSIPIHLVTREAIQLYFNKLTEHGLLVINISNRYINLEPVLGTLAENLGLSTLRQLEREISPAEKAIGKSASHWVLFARNQQDFGSLSQDARWQPISNNLQAPLWTDDFSNIFSVLRAFRH